MENLKDKVAVVFAASGEIAGAVAQLKKCFNCRGTISRRGAYRFTQLSTSTPAFKMHLKLR